MNKKYKVFALLVIPIFLLSNEIESKSKLKSFGIFKEIINDLSSNPQEKEIPFDLILGNMLSFNKVQYNIFVLKNQLEEKDAKNMFISDLSQYLDSFKYKDQLKNIFDSLILGNGQKPKYLKLDPVRIIPYKNKKCILINIVSENTYNTLRTSSNSRYADVLRACVIPNLSMFSEINNSEDIAYFGFIVTYGSANFIEEKVSPNLKAESGCIIINWNDRKKFVEAEISENELLARSGIYLSDRDMIVGIKKGGAS